MKINEVNQPEQLNELALSSFIGDIGAAGLKSLFTGKGMKQQMIQDMFLKDFYEDAITSLDNGIKGGLVDPNIQGTATASKNAGGGAEIDPNQVQPGAGQPGAPAAAGAKPGTAGAVAANKAQQQTSQNINNYVKQAAQAINSTTDKNQKIALTKELVNAMADRQGTPEWNNTVKGVEGIIKNAGADPSFASAAIGNLRAGKTMSEAWRIYFANKLVEAVGLTWKDLGLCVLKEGKNYYVADKKYAKLDYIFESILNEAEGAQSIAEYMTDWFDQYMTGVNWKARESVVLPMIQAIEDSYPGGYKKAIKTLAKTAFAISKSSPKSIPAGIKDEVGKLGGLGAAPAEELTPPDPNSANYAQEVAAFFTALSKSNPQEFERLNREMQEIAQKTASTAPKA